jgi:hypothetical protein
MWGMKTPDQKKDGPTPAPSLFSLQKPPILQLSHSNNYRPLATQERSNDTRLEVC